MKITREEDNEDERIWIEARKHRILINETAEGVIIDVFSIYNDDYDEVLHTVCLADDDREDDEFIKNNPED